ncbi:MAG: hypothetical protein SFU84_11315 [Gemmatimonadales bacterium]|nr:hypothetical protein [Gemmatimonadales bacterium]
MVVGLFGFRSRPLAFRALWGWLAFGLVLNVFMWRMAGHGQRTALVTQLSLPIFATLGLYAASRLTTSRRAIRWCLLATISYVLFWGWRFMHAEATGDFSVYTSPVLWMILTITAVWIIAVRLADSPANPLRDPILIAAMAILVSYAPAAALEPVSAALYASHRDLTLVLWIGKTWLLIVGYFLFTLALLWTLPPRSSPGFSSSVA